MFAADVDVDNAADLIVDVDVAVYIDVGAGVVAAVAGEVDVVC